MHVVTYRYAYTAHRIALCATCAPSHRYPLGPVEHGAHEGRCEDCQPTAEEIGRAREEAHAAVRQARGDAATPLTPDDVDEVVSVYAPVDVGPAWRDAFARHVRLALEGGAS